MKKKSLLITFILALVLRLISLNQSLWLDEATTAKVVQKFNLLEIIPKFSINDFHPPLYYLFMDIWTSLFGYSEIALRAPSVIFSLLTGWTIYLIVKKVKNEEVTLGSVIFFLLNPLIVYYSQEARMYMMVTFLLTAAVYFLLNKKYLWVNTLFFLSFLTFYGSAIFISSIYLWLIFKKRFEELYKIVPGFALSSLLVSPLLLQQFDNSRAALSSVKNWSLVLGKANIKNLLLIPIKFSIGRISFEPKIVYWAIAGIWTLITSFFVWKGSRTRRDFFFWVVGTLVLAFIISFNSPLLQYFRFLYLLPLFSILLAFGTTKKWQRATIAAVFMAFTLIYLINPSFHREDWRNLVKELPKDKKVFMITSSSDPVLYYNSSIKINDLKNISQIKDKEIVVIPYTADIHGVDYKSELQKKHYKLKETKSFREVFFERWAI